MSPSIFSVIDDIRSILKSIDSEDILNQNHIEYYFFLYDYLMIEIIENMKFKNKISLKDNISTIEIK